MKPTIKPTKAPSSPRRLVKACIALTLASSLFTSLSRSQDCSSTVGAPACSGQSDIGSSSPGYLPSPYVANPVDVVTGNKYQRSDDYLAFGSRLQFTRHYNSADSAENGVLGAGWRHSFDVSLKRAAEDRLLVKQSDGRIIEFLSDRDKPSIYRARHSADGYVVVAKQSRWVLPSGRVLTFKGSYLVKITSAKGKTIKLAYSNKRLNQVSDAIGRSIKLHYYAGEKTLGSYDTFEKGGSPGLLQSLELPDGSRINYQYDNLQNLVSVEYPEGTQTHYAYADPDFRNHMTGAYEALERIQKHWEYDQYGRAIKHINETAQLKIDIEFAPAVDSQTNRQTKVRTTDGWDASYQWSQNQKLNLPLVTQYRETACSDCKTEKKRFDEKSVLQWRQGEQAIIAITDAISFTPALGALGGTIQVTESTETSKTGASHVSQSYSITVDRLGTVRDLSDGAHSLSQLKASVFSASGKVASNRISPVTINRGSKVKNVKGYKLVKMLSVAQRANQQLGIPKINQTNNVGINNRFCAAPTYRNCTQLRHDYQMAQLSDCVYEDKPCTNGYVEVDPLSIGMSPDDFEKDGFKATLYKDPKTGKMTLAFRGTRATKPADWFNNIQQWRGKQSKYYDQARKLITVLTQKIGDFHLTGHSLGGGLATVASFISGNHSTVFNTAALHLDTIPNHWNSIKDADKHIVSYSVDGDILSELQEVHEPIFAGTGGPFPWNVGQGSSTNKPKPITSGNIPLRQALTEPGQHIVLDKPDKSWIRHHQAIAKYTGFSAFRLPKGIVLHSMDAVLKALKAKVLKQCKTLV